MIRGLWLFFLYFGFLPLLPVSGFASAAPSSPAKMVSSGTVLPVLSGSSSVHINLKPYITNELRQTIAPNKFEVYIELDAGENLIPLQYSGKSWEYILPVVPAISGYAALVIYVDSGEVVRVPKILRIIDKFHITLTFDDGPGQDKKSSGADISTSPTVKVLDGLDRFVHGEAGCKQGIKAAFFVLTTSDRFFHILYPKAETPQGRAILAEVARRGHLIGVHDGGEYRSQFNSHDERALQPAYGVYGKPASFFSNALESDLYECSQAIFRITGQVPAFVRPPLWRYASSSNPNVAALVAAAYKRYNLKMILTDARFPDGGYYLISIASFQKYGKFRKNLRRAFLSGEDNLIISMHDSNIYTANVITSILNMIGEEFERTVFCGASGIAGERLDFADSYEEVRNNLTVKNHYVMFPEYAGSAKQED